jgi:HAD superfamily hydrolase (TIGR01459 family)
MSPSQTSPIPILASVSDLVATSDAWICDVWGVLHNGRDAFLEAAAANLRFRESGGVVVLVSNAPRPAAAVIRQMSGLGVPTTAYDAVVTSGDLTRRIVGGYAGKGLFHMGPDRDKPIFDGLPLRFVAAADADVVICTGFLNDDTETPEDYRDALTSLVRRGVPMVCANPDLTVERGTQLVYCAGSLAALYEQIGGSVLYAGKPHLPVYDLAFETIDRLKGATVSRDRVLAIGDGLRTDIAGAHAARIRSLFIASAVHVKEPLSLAVLARLFDGEPARPVAAMAGLAW